MKWIPRSPVVRMLIICLAGLAAIWWWCVPSKCSNAGGLGRFRGALYCQFSSITPLGLVYGEIEGRTNQRWYWSRPRHFAYGHLDFKGPFGHAEVWPQSMKYKLRNTSGQLTDETLTEWLFPDQYDQRHSKARQHRHDYKEALAIATQVGELIRLMASKELPLQHAKMTGRFERIEINRFRNMRVGTGYKTDCYYLAPLWLSLCLAGLIHRKTVKVDPEID